MIIYLVRHADAVDEGPGLADAHRHLSLEGRHQAENLARGMSKAGVHIDVVLTSPLARAVQTAEMIAAALGYAGMVECLPALMPGGDVRDAAAAIQARAGAALAIGHEPGLSALAGVLCHGEPLPALRKAQVYCLRDGRPAWTLSAGERAPTPWPTP